MFKLVALVVLAMVIAMTSAQLYYGGYTGAYSPYAYNRVGYPGAVGYGGYYGGLGYSAYGGRPLVYG